MKASGDSMMDAGIFTDDWLVVSCQKEVEPGRIVVARFEGQTLVHRLMKDRNGWYLRPENVSHPIIRPEHENGVFDIVGEVIAIQRVLQYVN
jgi:SOS-response transcriptional repressor LexA